jgi:hypothetical protein
MPDRRHSLPLIGSSRLESDADYALRQTYIKRAAQLKTALTLAVCGVPILREGTDTAPEALPAVETE